MKAKEFITELNMAPGNLLKFVFSSPVAKNMRAGFEAELLVPGNAGDGDPDFDWDEDRTIPVNIDMADVRDFFELSRISRAPDQLETRYMTWVDKQGEDSIDQNILERIEYLQEQDPELDDDEAHNKAWDELHDEYFQNSTPSLYDFCRENHCSTWSALSDEFGFDWPYITYGGNFEDEVSPYAESLADSVDAMIQISSIYHGDNKEFAKGYWYIEPDESVTSDDTDYMGIEVVSPPMNILVMLDKLDKTLQWAKSQGSKTNASTGLHVGISMAGQTTENLDYIKLILFLGDRYVLERFGRAANTYTRSSLDILKNRVAYDGREIMLGAIDQLKRGLAIEASRSVLTGSKGKNVSIHLKEDYIEFRSMGYDYLDHYGAIQNTILRYVRAYAVASDPMAERQEYFKKLSKMLNPSNEDQLVPFVRYAAGQLNKQSLADTLKARKALKTAPLVSPAAMQKPENVFNPNTPF